MLDGWSELAQKGPAFGHDDWSLIGPELSRQCCMQVHVPFQVLAVTEDDKYGDVKRALCAQVRARLLSAWTWGHSWGQDHKSVSVKQRINGTASVGLACTVIACWCKICHLGIGHPTIPPMYQLEQCGHHIVDMGPHLGAGTPPYLHLEQHISASARNYKQSRLKQRIKGHERQVAEQSREALEEKLGSSE